jgi:hypothetical protein
MDLICMDILQMVKNSCSLSIDLNLSQNLKESKSWLLDKLSNLSIGINDFEKFQNTMKFYEALIQANGG